MTPAEKRAARAQGAALLRALVAAGAAEIEADVLQPAETLLDLYGEDIRARAYVTADPIRGEMMLRPDFTVPVVQAHMAGGAEPARYCYMGEVFRKQDRPAPGRAAEYFQVGFEIFARAAPERADAEVFALFSRLLAPLGLDATIGDIGLLTAAVGALETLEARKAALLRHIWRPAKFHALLMRYSGALPVPPARAALLAGGARARAPWLGLRAPAEMEARIARLAEDAAAAPIAAADVARLDALFALRCPAPEAPARLAALDLPAAAIARLEARLGALEAEGVDLGPLTFEASHGRASMEYYDGFVFTFAAPQAGGAQGASLPPVASGGRYDALTRVLGQGREIPAVGGILRPGMIAAMGGLAC